MNKKLSITILILLSALTISISTVASGMYKSTDIEKIKIQKQDIPDGFAYGQIPKFAQRVLKGNPWAFDRPAINRLTERIYPGGNSRSIKEIHMSIIARKETPFGDDIVCYIILYKDMSSAKKEISKVSDYVKHNSDRAMYLTQDNLIVFLHADNTDHFSKVRKIADKIQSRLNSL